MVSVADRRHVVGQRLVSDISVVLIVVKVLKPIIISNCYYACSVLIAVLGTSIRLCFTYQTHLDLQHGLVYWVTVDREFSDVTAPYRAVSSEMKNFIVRSRQGKCMLDRWWRQ